MTRPHSTGDQAAFDVICIGAGPTGLACAMEAKRAGLRSLVIDKGALCNSLYHYPINMLFFTTPERMEIGDLPMTTTGGKPTRVEALKYYRRAVEHYGLETRLYESVTSIDGNDGIVRRRNAGRRRRAPRVSRQENNHRHRLLRPAEPSRCSRRGLPNVSHYFTDAHPYWNQDVVVIGGKNSAAEAALDLFRGGARVTLIHRHPELGKNLKYWVKPDIENRIRAGEIQALFSTHVTRIEPGKVFVKNSGPEKSIPAAHVFAMTGYHPDFDFLEKQGIRLDPETRRPEVNPDTLETNVPGIYVAGVVVGGLKTSDIFIENGRFHGRQIISAITGKGKLHESAPVAPPGE